MRQINIHPIQCLKVLNHNYGVKKLLSPMTPCSRQNENVQWSHQAETGGLSTSSTMYDYYGYAKIPLDWK